MSNWHVSLAILSTPRSKVCASSSASTHDRQLIDLPFQDVRWSNIERKTPMARFRNPWNILSPAKCLPLSLAFLHRLVLADTRQERGTILLTRWLSGRTFFYGWGIESPYDRPVLSEMNKEEQGHWIIPPTACDDDDGPEKAWRWAYADHGRESWFNSFSCGHLRKWGYVMWDSDRLDGCGVLDMNMKWLESRVGFYATE